MPQESKLREARRNNAGTDKLITVLVVDDSRSQRRILSAYLSRWGYSVIEAGSGAEALQACQAEQVDLIVSDWMMPGMNGLEFCQAFRALERESYGYFILLTSKSEKGEVARGLDMGADDFLSKPVAANEFLARIRAGERVLSMEQELIEKNRLVNETLAEISALYDSLDRDLAEARNMQQSLVREKFRDFGPADISLLLLPSGHVGGDLVGFFQISEHQVGVFSVDVSGHGVASALMTARLAAYLTGTSPDRNLALKRSSDGTVIARSPAEAAENLNRLFLEGMETELYFTMMLGHFDMRTGLGTFTQCGHPSAAVQRANGQVELCGGSGMPIGLIEGASWEDFTIQLNPGDRILLMSDGITECPGVGDEMLEEEGLVDILKRNAHLRGDSFFETLIWDLTTYAQDKPFPDDVSAALLQYRGPT